MNTKLTFKRAKNISNLNDTVINLSDPASVLVNPKHFEQEVILPKYSVPGHFFDAKYNGLIFHIVVTPIFSNYADFRLTDYNKYEFIGFDGKSESEFTEEFVEECAEEMSEDFEEISTEDEYFILSENGKSVRLNIGTPDWAQSHYERKATNDELKELGLNEDYNQGYITDYNLPVFKDENGDTLMFITEVVGDSFFGVYYLYYSPKTKLVRQFFQCT